MPLRQVPGDCADHRFDPYLHTATTRAPTKRIDDPRMLDGAPSLAIEQSLDREGWRAPSDHADTW